MHATSKVCSMRLAFVKGVGSAISLMIAVSWGNSLKFCSPHFSRVRIEVLQCKAQIAARGQEASRLKLLLQCYS